MKQHNIDNNQICFNIRMISEGSCDTEDFSNDAGNSAFHHRNDYILKCIQIENSYVKL